MHRRILAVLVVTASVSALGGCALGAFGAAAVLAAGAAIALGAFAACSGRRAADVESRTCLQVAPDVAPEPPDTPERGPCLSIASDYEPEPERSICLSAPDDEPDPPLPYDAATMHVCLSEMLIPGDRPDRDAGAGASPPDAPRVGPCLTQPRPDYRDAGTDRGRRDVPRVGPCLRTPPRPDYRDAGTDRGRRDVPAGRICLTPIPRTCLYASPPGLHGRLPIRPGSAAPPPAVPLDAAAEALLVDRGLLTGDQIARLRRLREG
ncbi:MAG: hypothetical protein QME96_06540 [Myxococcota bacterium]|nr:hypothetical protein [Myxococcota bacterium]